MVSLCSGWRLKIITPIFPVFHVVFTSFRCVSMYVQLWLEADDHDVTLDHCHQQSVCARKTIDASSPFSFHHTHNTPEVWNEMMCGFHLHSHSSYSSVWIMDESNESVCDGESGIARRRRMDSSTTIARVM